MPAEPGLAVSSRGPAPLVELCGLPVCRLDCNAVVDRVAAALERGEGGWLLTLTLDYLRLASVDREARELFAGADLAVADGMPLVWATRLRGNPVPERVAGSDLVWLLAERAARDGRSLFLLGGNPGAAEQAATRLQQRWPALRIAGTSSPMFSARPSSAEVEAAFASLRDAQPDLVYVGLGMPKQDRVIAALRGALPRAWWVGVGISLSFISGEVKRAPLWMQRSGLEWLHRLVQEPGRLARRYLIQDLPFALRLLAESRAARYLEPPVSSRPS